ncbi:MAG: SDR family oxidoreductase, partial [Actinomycetota bacterium]|nr:SDR family oxidoreductase [Actinomycetota bacterium]
MNFARLGDPGAEIPVLQFGGDSFDLRPVTADIDGSFLAASGWDRARDAHAAGSLPILENAAAMRIGAPVVRPTKIVCIGLNYRDHAEETHAEIPAEPVVFMKDPSTLIGPHDDVLVPRRSVKTDWEVELAVVVGSTARYLDSPDDALTHIAGYALSHDVSEREFQLERGGQWDKGKSCETFNPFGPVPASEVADPQALGMRLWVNGVQRQNGTTADTFAMADHVRERIRVNCVSPGTVSAPFVDRMLSKFDDPVAERAALDALQATGRMVAPDEVAGAILYLASPLSASTTGTSLEVDGGVHNLRVRPRPAGS